MRSLPPHRCEVVLKFPHRLSDEPSSFRKFEREMSGQTVPADFSGHMLDLDLDEDEDLEVFSKVKRKSAPKTRRGLRTRSFKQFRWLSCYVESTVALTNPL